MAASSPADLPPRVEATPEPAATESRRHTPAEGDRTRTRLAFNGVLALVVVLILLIVFILENTQSVKVSYFGANGHVPLGLALLVAAVGGALVAGLAGAARVVQLRRRMRRFGTTSRAAQL